MSLIYLGNAAVHEVHHEDSAPDGAVRFGAEDSGLKVLTREDRNGNACEIRLPEGLKPLESLTDIVGIWRHQSPEPPEWVAGEDATVVALLVEQFGCPEKDLDEARTAYRSQCGFIEESE